MQLSHGLLSFEQLQGMRSEFVLDTSQVSENAKQASDSDKWLQDN